MAIISAEQFRNKAVSIIEIPGFENGETFEIRVKKLSLVGLMSSGKIPNSLMKVVKDTFAGIKSTQQKENEKGDEKDNESENDSQLIERAGDIGKLMDIVCREAMLEPRYDDISDVMNDAQKLAVFQFTQGGVEQAKSFPTDKGDSGRTDNVENVSRQTE